MDQSLACHGRVRQGMGEDAVYIAWGQPDRKIFGGKGKEDQETWLYERMLTAPEPFGAPDQYGPGHIGGPPSSFWLPVGFGYRAYSDVGPIHYQPHMRLIETRFQRADFIGKKLVRYVDRRDGLARDKESP